MRQLWMHRDMQILQGYMTRYLYSSKFITKDRAEIQWQWEKIKKTMEETLKEMDNEANQKK